MERTADFVRRCRRSDARWRHGLSLFGNLKYAADFKHFDYVNPEAPKGGRVRLGAPNSFDSLNPYTYKGDAAALVSLTNDTLMTSAFDEPSTEYGLVAEAVQHPDDFAWVTYRLRQGARFHDGKPMTPEDVVWSMEALRGSHPFYAAYYKNIRKAEQTGDREVRFEFTESGNRELPQIVGQLPVLPKHWWTGKDDKGRQRDINATTLEPPLGSGPYRIANVRPGASITVTRVEDYWGKDLPVNVGANNVNEITAIYFADETVMLEAFKGDGYDFRIENSAKNWATGYDVPAVRRGAIKRQEVTLKNPDGMQCFCLNLRREKFADPRVRLAFNHAFDFEWANANLFYGQYVRTASYFANSELALVRPAKPRRACHSRAAAGSDPARGVHRALRQPGQWQCPGAPPESAQGAQPLRRGRLEGGCGPHFAKRGRPAHAGRVHAQLADLRAHRAPLCRAIEAARRPVDRAHHRQRAI